MKEVWVITVQTNTNEDYHVDTSQGVWTTRQKAEEHLAKMTKSQLHKFRIQWMYVDYAPSVR